MGRRSKDPPLEAIAGLVFLVIFFFGAVVVAILKVVATFLICGVLLFVIVLAGYGCYKIGRRWWTRKLNVDEFLPVVDWSPPTIPGIDAAWSNIIYPAFPHKEVKQAANIFGTSGAWSDVLGALEGIPAFQTAADPSELKRRVQAFRDAESSIETSAVEEASKLLDGQRAHLEYQLTQFSCVHEPAEARIRAQLDKLGSTIEKQASGNFWERRRAERLRSILSANEIRLREHVRDIQQRAKRQEQSIRDLLDPKFRAEKIRSRIQHELGRLEEITTSKEFAGAIAEMAVIAELSQVPAHWMVVNNLKLAAPRYIHNRGNPIQSAQIDTLVITPAGVFIIEVKNWSRAFSESGEGFSPFDQVSRASYLVSVILKEAGLDVKVRPIVTSQGSLPEKGEAKVAVKAMKQLRGYIGWFDPAGVDAQTVYYIIQQAAQ